MSELQFEDLVPGLSVEVLTSIARIWEPATVKRIVRDEKGIHADAQWDKDRCRTTVLVPDDVDHCRVRLRLCNRPSLIDCQMRLIADLKAQIETVTAERDRLIVLVAAAREALS